MNELNQVDLAFVVDTTGSMGNFIDAAKRHMVAMLQALTSQSATPIHLQVGVVEYRDHPPQDHTFVARGHGFSANLKAVQKTIDGLKPDGGGDTSEAVYDGLQMACAGLPWRPHSQRLAVLIGDSPPHGCHSPSDGFPHGCPCGQTAESITALLEQQSITLYALGLTRYVDASFGKLAGYTGGAYCHAERVEDTIKAMENLLAKEFGDLDFDRQVLECCQQTTEWTVDRLSTALTSPRARLSASLSRLGRRGLLAAK